MPRLLNHDERAMRPAVAAAGRAVVYLVRWRRPAARWTAKGMQAFGSRAAEDVRAVGEAGEGGSVEVLGRQRDLRAGARQAA